MAEPAAANGSEHVTVVTVLNPAPSNILTEVPKVSACLMNSWARDTVIHPRNAHTVHRGAKVASLSGLLLSCETLYKAGKR